MYSAQRLLTTLLVVFVVHNTTAMFQLFPTYELNRNVYALVKYEEPAKKEATVKYNIYGIQNKEIIQQWRDPCWYQYLEDGATRNTTFSAIFQDVIRVLDTNTAQMCFQLYYPFGSNNNEPWVLPVEWCRLCCFWGS